jgi:ABC-type amino acid transport substrate-binding protein
MRPSFALRRRGLIAALALAAAAPARAAPDGSLRRVLEAGVIRLGVQVEGTAAAARGADGALWGYLPVLGRHIAEGLGVRAEFVAVPRGDMLGQLIAGHFDLGLGGAIASPWVALTVLLSDPIMEFELVALTPRDVVAHGMADLRELSVGVVEGRSFVEAVREAGLPEERLTIQPDWEGTAEALARGGRQAAIVPAHHVGPIQRLAPQVVRRFSLGQFLHCAILPLGQHDLLRALNVLLYLLRMEGRLDGLHQTFFGRGITPRRTL